MLADERSSALIQNFAGQWLYLRNMRAVRPDPEVFPDFDDTCGRRLNERPICSSPASCTRITASSTC